MLYQSETRSEKRLSFSDYTLLFIGALFFSLVNYGKELATVALIFFVLYALKNRQTVIHSSTLKCAALLFSLVCLYTLLAQYFPTVFLSQDSDKARFMMKIAQSIILVASTLVAAMIFNRDSLQKIILALLKFNLAIFYIQVVLYYLFAYDWDILQIFTDVSQRNEYLGFYRPTGLYAEPSNYSMIIITLLTGLIILNYRKNSIFYFAIFSLFLTYSTAAALAGGVMLIAVALHLGLLKKASHLLWFLIILSAVLAIALTFLTIRFEGLRSLTESRDIKTRQVVIMHLFAREVDEPKLYFGEGIYSYDKKLLDTLSQHNKVQPAVDDSGLIINYVFRFGLLGFLLAGAMFFSLKGLAGKLAFISFLLMKVSITTGIFFFPLICLLIVKKTAVSEQMSTDNAGMRLINE